MLVSREDCLQIEIEIAFCKSDLKNDFNFRADWVSILSINPHCSNFTNILKRKKVGIRTVLIDWIIFLQFCNQIDSWMIWMKILNFVYFVKENSLWSEKRLTYLTHTLDCWQYYGLELWCQYHFSKEKKWIKKQTRAHSGDNPNKKRRVWTNIQCNTHCCCYKLK